MTREGISYVSHPSGPVRPPPQMTNSTKTDRKQKIKDTGYYKGEGWFERCVCFVDVDGVSLCLFYG